jgi:hypothetical protein
MSERAACELREMAFQAIDRNADSLLRYAAELEGALAKAQWALREVRAIALDGDDGRIPDAQERCDAIEEVTRAVVREANLDPRGRTRKPVGELWPGTIFEAGGKEFFLVCNRGDKVFGAKIEGGAFAEGVSFPQSCPVTVVDDSRAVERIFWEPSGLDESSPT